MKKFILVAASIFFLTGYFPNNGFAAQENAGDAVRPKIATVDPPEKDFFSKLLDFQGIPIKAHAVVADEALYAAYDRLSLLLSNQPMVVSNLTAAGVELHIIGRDQ